MLVLYQAECNLARALFHEIDLVLFAFAFRFALLGPAIIVGHTSQAQAEAASFGIWFSFAVVADRGSFRRFARNKKETERGTRRGGDKQLPPSLWHCFTHRPSGSCCQCRFNACAFAQVACELTRSRYSL